MSKRALTVGFLTAGLSVGVVASVISPAAAQGNPVGGSGSYFFLSGAGSNGGAAQKVVNFGNPNDETYFGDWDNTGSDSPMVRRGNTFFVADDNGQLQSSFSYGDAGDKAVIGDWNGDGKDSIAVQRGNHFFVKNDNTKSGKADTDFFYGDNGDVVLAGDWDGNATDTLAVQRQNRFFVKNDTKTGIADYDFYFGDAGDAVLVGDWANPATNTDGNGADQLAVRRVNHFYLSADLGTDGKGGSTTLRDFFYGDAGDQVFVASLPTAMVDKDGKPVVDTVRPQTYAADTAAAHKAGDPILNATGGSVGAGYTQATDSVTGQGKTYAGGEPVVAVPGLPQVYRGGEGVITGDGKPVVYVASGATTDANRVDITTAYGWASTGTNTGTVAKYKAGEPVLNADGTFVWVKNSPTNWTIQTWAATDTATTKALPTGAANTVKVTVGDQLISRAGETRVLPKGSPAVYGATAVTDTDGKVAGDFVVNHKIGDVVFNADGSIARNANGTVKTYTANDVSTTATYKSGAPIMHRKGEPMMAYKWVPTAAGATRNSGGDGTTTNLSATVTSATAAFVSTDVGADISGVNIPVGAKIVTVNSATSVTISAAATATGTTSVLTIIPVVAAHWDNAATASNVVTDDEDATLYTSSVLVSSAPDPSKSVTKLDANSNSDLAFYAGTEQYVTTGSTALGVTVGGELVGGHKAGEPVLDANGNIQMTGDGKPVTITGDGLGVRRSF